MYMHLVFSLFLFSFGELLVKKIFFCFIFYMLHSVGKNHQESRSAWLQYRQG